MFFGQHKPGRRVEMRGKSKAEGSREEVIEQARLEREKRKRAKLEQKSASTIQAHYRRWIESRHVKQQLAAAWDAEFGITAERADLRSLQLQSNFLRSFLFFTDVRNEQDVTRLSAVCSFFFKSMKGPDLAALLEPLNSDAEARAVLLYRLHKLALLCLKALCTHRGAFQPILSSSRQAQSSHSLHLAVPLIDCLIALVSPETWAPRLTGSNIQQQQQQQQVVSMTPTELAASVVSSLAYAGMFKMLFQILHTATSASVQAPKSFAETLATQLTARFLALKSFTPKDPSQSIHNLLFVPLLWSKASSLLPISARIARQALVLLGAAQWWRAATLAALLPRDVAGGRAGAAAALLGNLLVVGTRVLQPDKGQPLAVVHGWALQLTRVMHAAVSLLPLSPFFLAGAAAFGASEDDDADGSVGTSATASTSSRHADRLQLEGEEMVPSELVVQMQLISDATGRQLLKQLVALLLPEAAPGAAAGAANGSASSSSGSGGGGGGNSKAAVQGVQRAVASYGEGAYVLCQLLQQMVGLPAHRQRVLLTLAVSADFVERLWFTILRCGHAGELAGVPTAAAWYTPRHTASSLQAAESSSGGSSNGPAAAGSSSSSSSNLAANSRPDGMPAVADHVSSATLTAAPSWIMDLEGRAVEGAGPSGFEENPGWMLPMHLCCAAFSSHLMTSDLDEFYKKQKPLALRELYDPSRPEAGFLRLLKDCLWQVLWTDSERHYSSPAAARLQVEFCEAAGRLYGQLYDRNCRHAFAPTTAFHASGLPPDRFAMEASSSRAAAGRLDTTARVWMVLRHAPSLIPFQERARLFQQEVSQDRKVYRDMETSHFMEHGTPMNDGHRFVPIRRDQLLFDGFDHMGQLGEALKGRVRVQFINEHGVPEAGVDGGGLFKDFMEALMKEGFNSQYGLFITNSNNQLFPNPAASMVVEDAFRLLEFLGRMLGKALYEGILLELPFAGFFLKKFRGANNDINDLPTLDPEVYRNLMLLRHHDGNVADLSLTFTVTDSLYGQNREVELKPGGRHIPVTNDNVMEYIHRVADYRLNQQLRAPTSAFLRGFYDLIKPEWVSMFNEEELQMLISGSEAGLDLEDLKANVHYAGGYHKDHPVIHCFWEALATFSHEEQRAFLKFVTACSRAPLLGFRYLEPQLCIQLSGSMLDPSAVERLPTSATCMNLLKLPPYRTAKMMRDKLLYAVQSGAGFELS